MDGQGSGTTLKIKVVIISDRKNKHRQIGNKLMIFNTFMTVKKSQNLYEYVNIIIDQNRPKR